MGTLLRFVNAVADAVAERYPDVLVDTLAYQYTRNVPKLTRPRRNVIIRLCSIECCFRHPLTDETCPENRSTALYPLRQLYRPKKKFLLSVIRHFV